MKTPNPSVKTYERPVKTKASDHCCRMCLTRLRLTEMIDIFRVESEPLTNSSIIHFCTGLEISENDGLPTRMCSQCYRNLMDFFAFKRMCLASDNCLKSSRDAALKEAEIPDCSESLPEYVIKDEPQDELSLAENSDMGLLETDGFHPDAPDEVFSQIGKFELEEECSEQNWRGYGIPVLQRPPVPFVVEEDDSCNADEENFEEKAMENLSGTPLESSCSPAEPEPNVPPSLERKLQTPTSDGLCSTMTLDASRVRPPYVQRSESDINRAMQLLRSGNTLRKVSTLTGIPRSVLHRHYTAFKKGRKMKDHGGQAHLGAEIERLLVAHIAKLGEWGYPLNHRDLRHLVKSFLDRKGEESYTFKDNLPGRKWMRGFLKRHRREVSLRLCQNVKQARADLPRFELETLFENWVETLDNVPSGNIYNYDETNLTDDPGQQKVSLKRCEKYRVLTTTKASTSQTNSSSPYEHENAMNTDEPSTSTGIRHCRSTSSTTYKGVTPTNQINVGDWIVVRFPKQNSKVQVKSCFLGCVNEIDEQVLSAKFVRPEKGRNAPANSFVWPLVEDEADFDMGMVIGKVQPPKEGRRGKLTFDQLNNVEWD